MSNKLAITLIFLTSISAEAAAPPMVPGQKEANEGIQEFLNGLEIIEQKGPTCTSSLTSPSKCPKVFSKNTREAFLEPTMKDIQSAKQKLTHIKLEDATNKSVNDVKSIAGEAAICDRELPLIADSKKRKAGIDAALTSVKTVHTTLVKKRSELFASSKEIGPKVLKCAEEAGGSPAVSFVNNAGVPKNQLQSLILVFSPDPMHGSCDTNVVKTLQQISLHSLKKAIEGLETMKKYLEQKSSDLTTVVSQSEQRYKSCSTPPADGNKMITGQKAEAKSSDVTAGAVPKEGAVSSQAKVAEKAEEKPAEKTETRPEERGNASNVAKAVIVDTEANKENTGKADVSASAAAPENAPAQVVAEGAKPGEKTEEIDAKGEPEDDSAKNQAATVEKEPPGKIEQYYSAASAYAGAKWEDTKSYFSSFFGSESAKTETPKTETASNLPIADEVALRPKEAAPSAPALAPDEVANVPSEKPYPLATETKPMASAPSAVDSPNPYVRNDALTMPAGYDSEIVKNRELASQTKASYSKDPIFTARDLDFNSSKDTKIIQNALNQVRAQNPNGYYDSFGGTSITADGKFGSRTTQALDVVMKDPVQKAAFLKALKTQMK